MKKILKKDEEFKWRDACAKIIGMDEGINDMFASFSCI
jgi:hypothetical protein